MLLKILNLTHLRCPDTIIVIRKNIRNIQYGEKILILSNDISTTWDIPLLCNCMNYTLLKKNTHQKPYQFLIKK
ncbi:sulfurtransferase TusA [Buchnera aphidicola]|uniref:Sulfurtransferase TusA n=1 Tax=Buchnera aphidicola (Stegophylla sp.) TaxID=2315800 RepID=A0A4D6YN27_9GAMM|nr:sulfurtransferase TusA [Buchnera aphidicola (Stegophylla sp.)]QCI26435.1 sulfurtransferase TusA [Buchnera aphidicola (Stegophylla sp.)]